MNRYPAKPVAGWLDDIGGVLAEATEIVSDVWDGVKYVISAGASALESGGSSSRDALRRLRDAEAAVGRLTAQLADVKARTVRAQAEMSEQRNALLRLLNRRNYEAQAAALVMAEFGVDWQVVRIGGIGNVPPMIVEANESPAQIAAQVVPVFPAALAAARALSQRPSATLSDATNDDDDGGLLSVMLGAGLGFLAGRATGKKDNGRGPQR